MFGRVRAYFVCVMSHSRTEKMMLGSSLQTLSSFSCSAPAMRLARTHDTDDHPSGVFHANFASRPSFSRSQTKSRSKKPNPKAKKRKKGKGKAKAAPPPPPKASGGSEQPLSKAERRRLAQEQEAQKRADSLENMKRTIDILRSGNIRNAVLLIIENKLNASLLTSSPELTRSIAFVKKFAPQIISDLLLIHEKPDVVASKKSKNKQSTKAEGVDVTVAPDASTTSDQTDTACVPNYRHILSIAFSYMMCMDLVPADLDMFQFLDKMREAGRMHDVHLHLSKAVVHEDRHPLTSFSPTKVLRWIYIHPEIQSMHWLSFTQVVVDMCLRRYRNNNILLEEWRNLMFSSKFCLPNLGGLVNIFRNQPNARTLFSLPFINYLISTKNEEFARVAAGLLEEYRTFSHIVSSKKYHRDHLAVELVSNANSLARANTHLRKAQVVGLDQETQPMFRSGPRKKVSTLQISTHSCCFIFDMLNFPGHLRQRLYELLRFVFENPKIAKIGQTFANDLRELRRSYPDASCFNNVHCLIEASDLLRDFCPGCPTMSLAKMSLFCFGYNLDKSQQMSNWGRRPLSPKQLRYAALDAFILIDIVDYLGKKLGLPFHQICSKHSHSITEGQQKDQDVSPPPEKRARTT